MLDNSHKTRLATSAIGLPLAAAALFFGGWPLFLAVTAVSACAQWEFHGLFPGGSRALRLPALVLGALLLALSWRFGPAASLAVLAAAFWLEEFTRLAGGSSREAGPRWTLLAGLLYVPTALQFLLSFPASGSAVLLAAVMATDTGAYYAGHLIGGPKVWPRVSPKKTWAGCLGGLASAVAVCLAAGLVLGGPGLSAWIGLGAALSVACQFGDFVESSLKRAAGLKDSGCILPGHGGLLDRIDGLLPATLVYALARTLAAFP